MVNAMNQNQGKNKRPGVMLYFDRMGFLSRLSYEQCGRLFLAVLAYGEGKELPPLEDDLERLAWEFIRPGLDQDEQRYEAICEKRRRAAEKRWERDRALSANACQPQNQPSTTAAVPEAAPDSDSAPDSDPYPVPWIRRA